jgi:hypothetical protein
MSEGEIFSIILYGAIGIAGALSFLFFVWGFITYISRLGTERRNEGIHVMEWGVALVITVIVLIAIQNLLQNWFPVFN